MCLPAASSQQASEFPGGCASAGWGGTKKFEVGEDEAKSDILQEADMLVLATERCNQKLTEAGLPEFVDADTNICAGHLDGDVGVCFVSMI